MGHFEGLLKIQRDQAGYCEINRDAGTGRYFLHTRPMAIRQIQWFLDGMSIALA